MDQPNRVCGVTRIAFDLKGEALEITLMDHHSSEMLTPLVISVVIDIHSNLEVPCGGLII